MDPQTLPIVVGKFMVHLYDHSLIKIGALSCPCTRDGDCKTSCFIAWKHPETHFSLSNVSSQCHKEQLPSYQGIRIHPGYRDSHHPVLSLEQLIKSHKCSGGQQASQHTQVPTARVYQLKAYGNWGGNYNARGLLFQECGLALSSLQIPLWQPLQPPSASLCLWAEWRTAGGSPRPGVC